jgi:GNAT superfamily N-acetyltransferase
MTAPARVDADALPAIASLCERSIANSPTADELAGALFAPEQPAIVRGDPATGIVATVFDEGTAYVRLLVVAPGARGNGVGGALLRAAEHDARAGGSPSLTIGADAPYFLFAGVPAELTETVAFFEGHHYTRVEANFDMTIDLTALPPDPGGHELASASDHEALDRFMAEHWPNWHAETMRALQKGNLVITRDAAGITSICAFEVNRAGFLGPVAARPDLIGKGVARPALVGALHELRSRGRSSIEVAWVGPVVPYARLGGRVSTVYFVYRKELR